MDLSKAGFVLGIRPVSSLFPHEQIIPEHVRQLSSGMLSDGVQKDPIIIDGGSATVLDGMHRLAAFKALRVENAVVCAVDYSSPAVTLRRWARVYNNPGSSGQTELLDRAGPVRRVTLAEAFSVLEGKESGMALFTSDAAFLPEGQIQIWDAVGRVNSIDKLVEDGTWKRTFVPEEEVDIPLQDRRNVVVLLRRLTKDEVVNAARSGNLLPCKTSMHAIDPRPVGVNFPIPELNHATSATLRERLGGRGERLLPPESVYEGRRYKERLLLLNPS